MGLGHPAFVDNPEARCPVVLMLDTSKSMAGAPIEELVAGVAAFRDDVRKDDIAALRVEVAIVSFGGAMRVAQDFVTIDQFEPPVLAAAGDTPMGAAIDCALDLIEKRKALYRENGIPYYRPWAFLITDGEPTDGQRWEIAARRVHAAETDRKLTFFAVGVGDANMDILGCITPPSRPPLMLERLRFRKLFEWLSTSLKRVSSGRVGGEMVALPPVESWARTGT
ncbi:MAG: VWA domain-containing protein [Alphaproteobacteria bacterium]|nr:VWA domain-containing protein [Alphaproteobacteria bacterium]